MSQSDTILKLAELIPSPDNPEPLLPANKKRRQVSENEIDIILSAARTAPSADNAQIWRFITVREKKAELLEDSASEEMQKAFSSASALIVACGVPFIVTRTRKEQPFAMIDVPIAILHLLFQAAELGLDFCWTLDCDEEKTRKNLGIPENVRIVGMVAIS